MLTESHFRAVMCAVGQKICQYKHFMQIEKKKKRLTDFTIKRMWWGKNWHVKLNFLKYDCMERNEIHVQMYSYITLSMLMYVDGRESVCIYGL